MTYNMEDFFRSCVDLYLALSRERGFNANLRNVSTPFIAEDQAESPQGAPCGTGPVLYCPYCRHAFSQSQSISDKELRFQALLRELRASGGNDADANEPKNAHRELPPSTLPMSILPVVFCPLYFASMYFACQCFALCRQDTSW